MGIFGKPYLQTDFSQKMPKAFTFWAFALKHGKPAGNMFSTLRGGGGGGGGVQAFHFGKNDFELGIGGDGQDTSRHFEGSFRSIRAILPM